ncbi:MAG: GTPase [Rhodospirillales bacterium]|nr:GTPase [Rhodospirillales bacterium]
MTEAMRMVRESLGEDAIIVATGEEDGGRSVSVTAAIDPGPAFELGRGGAPAVSRDWLQYDEEEDQSAVAEAITDAMLRHGVPEDVTDQIVSCATVMALEQPHIALIAALEHLFTFRPLSTLPLSGGMSTRPVLLAGMPGAGKTLAAAKIAARGALAGRKMSVITMDTVRAGGVEQLAAFTTLLNVPLVKARNVDELVAAVDRARDVDQIVVDTGGVNPFSAEELRGIGRVIESVSCDPVLVLPGGIDAEESGDIGRLFASVGVRRLLPSRLDVARRLGGLLQAAHQGGLAFSDASCTPQVAAGLVSLDPAALSDFLMPAGSERAGQTTMKAAG